MGRFYTNAVLSACLAVGGVTASIPAAAQTKATAPAKPVVANPVEVKEANDLYEFRYVYPAQAAAIPALKKWLETDLTKQRSDIIECARETKSYLEEGDFFSPHTHETEWKVVTNLPSWLSLSASVWEYTGGAHGNSWPKAVIWDKQANVRRSALDLFVSKAAFTAAVRVPFCRALNLEQSKRRGEPVNPKDGGFSACPDPADTPVLLGSSNKTHFTRIGIVLPPYAAGPYSEGFYEFTLPVTPAVIKAVKPQYRAAFAVGR